LPWLDPATEGPVDPVPAESIAAAPPAGAESAAAVYGLVIEPAIPEPTPATARADTAVLPAPVPASSNAVMRPLYLTFGVLQGLDVYTTRVALARGARETNPLMGGLADKPAALVAVKAAATFGTVYLVERLRIRHPVAAAITMAAIDSAYVMLVVRNAQVARQARGGPGVRSR
jgi:hypothetical protein